MVKRAREESVLILDVRPPEECAAGNIRGAVSILLNDYCGCCPWTDCPNMQPAHAAVESTERTVKVLYVAKNLQTDWIDTGLPTESGMR